MKTMKTRIGLLLMQVGFTGGCGDYSIGGHSGEITLYDRSMIRITADEIKEFTAVNADVIRTYINDPSKGVVDYGYEESTGWECLTVEEYLDALLLCDERIIEKYWRGVAQRFPKEWFNDDNNEREYVEINLAAFRASLVAHILSDPITDIEYLKKWQ
jgi:hypothetical protein